MIIGSATSFANEEQILTTAQAATLLGVPEATMRYWRFVGSGPRSFKLGARKVAYKKSDVTAWLEKQYMGEEAGTSPTPSQLPLTTPPHERTGTTMRTDCNCDDLPDGTPVDHHVTIRVTAGHGRILRLDINGLPYSSRTNRPVLAAQLRRIANALEQQEATT